MKTIKALTIIILVLMVCSCRPGGPKQTVNTLSTQEAEEGWVLLFDGVSTNGWKNFNQDTLSGWTVEEACLVGQGLGGDIGGDIVSVKDYDNFILKWEWKLGPHGNSGVMYHVKEDAKYAAGYETGPEYQLIEDGNFRNELGEAYHLEPWQETAADYAMYEASDQKQVNVRDWNSSKILFTPEKAEYWLNGIKVVEFEPWSEDWTERRNSGKWDAYPDYGKSKSGKICLQDHGSKIWFRNIRIKEL